MENNELDDGSERWCDSQRFPHITAVCAALGLDSEARLGLQDSCSGLVAAKSRVRVGSSPSEVANELRKTSAALTKCVDLLCGSVSSVEGEIDQALCNSSIGEILGKVPTEKISRYFTPSLTGLIEALEQAAQVLSESAQTRPATGRKPVRANYARTVLEVGYCLKASGISVSRGGKFQRVCDAVWSDARMVSNSESAIRHALDNMREDWKMYGL